VIFVIVNLIFVTRLHRYIYIPFEQTASQMYTDSLLYGLVTIDQEFERCRQKQ